MSSTPTLTRADPVALASEGRFAEAISSALAAGPDPELESLVRQWRHQAFVAAPKRPPPGAWPPLLPDPFPGEDGLPEVAAADLDVPTLGGAILHHGCLLVRGLASHLDLQPIRDGIDKALAGQAAFEEDGPTPYYDPFPLPYNAANLAFGRAYCKRQGVVWMADSPRMMTLLIEVYQRLGLIDLIGDYLGERPAMSLAKSSLRRIAPVGTERTWHQDGAFLGKGVRTVNCWLGLSRCGRDAPGLDIVARRFDHIVDTADNGATWWVNPEDARRIAGEARIVSPEFEEGDALLFDHMCLHRTAVLDGMTKPRWALECWFFAPTDYPMDQIPFLI